MSTAEITHSEQWQMILSPDEGEEWPAQPVPYSTTGKLYRPETLIVVITRGAEHPTGRIKGRRLLETSQSSQGISSWGICGSEFPGWAQEIIERERRAHDLGPGATGCGW